MVVLIRAWEGGEALPNFWEENMILQAYNDGCVKIFRGNQHICSFTVIPPLKPAIERHLKMLRMCRNTKWVDCPEWGSETNVRFR